MPPKGPVLWVRGFPSPKPTPAVGRGSPGHVRGGKVVLPHAQSHPLLPAGVPASPPEFPINSMFPLHAVPGGKARQPQSSRAPAPLCPPFSHSLGRAALWGHPGGGDDGGQTPPQCPMETGEEWGDGVTAPGGALQHNLHPILGCELSSPPSCPCALRSGRGQGPAWGQCPRRGQSCGGSACPRRAIREEEEDAPGTGPARRGQLGSG